MASAVADVDGPGDVSAGEGVVATLLVVLVGDPVDAGDADVECDADTDAEGDAECEAVGAGVEAGAVTTVTTVVVVIPAAVAEIT